MYTHILGSNFWSSRPFLFLQFFSFSGSRHFLDLLPRYMFDATPSPSSHRQIDRQINRQTNRQADRDPLCIQREFILTDRSSPPSSDTAHSFFVSSCTLPSFIIGHSSFFLRASTSSPPSSSATTARSSSPSSLTLILAFLFLLLKMSAVNVTNVTVFDNPAPFLNPFQFEISYECHLPLEDGKRPANYRVVFVSIIIIFLQRLKTYLS